MLGSILSKIEVWLSIKFANPPVPTTNTSSFWTSNSSIILFIIPSVKDMYPQNKDDFNSYLVSYNLNISDIKEKLKIETLWNEMIFQKQKSR